MLSNIVPPVPPQDREHLERFFKSDHPEAEIIKRIFEMYLEYFRDIRHIALDDKNIGLQACSHLRAYDMLEQILGSVTASSGRRDASEGKKVKSFK